MVLQHQYTNMVRRTQLIRVAIGTIFLLSTSFLFFFLYSYQTGVQHERLPDAVQVGDTNNDQALQDTTLPSPDLEPVTVTVVSWKTATATATESSDEAICTKPNTRLTAEDLDVEQIEADFPNGYVNPHDWFKTPATPLESEIHDLVSEEELSVLTEIRAEAQVSTKQLDKITSFYGIDRMGSWNDHIESLDSDGLAPLTKWVQKYIYDHQHPTSCEGKKFYVLENRWPKHGLGAIIRRVFIELSLAIQADRILVLDPKNAPGNTLVEKNCAKLSGYAASASLECLFERITSCADYVTEENSIRTIAPTDIVKGGKRDVPALVTLAMMTYAKETGLTASGTLIRYWWRSQLYGYIVRPNRPTLARMAEMRMNTTIHKGFTTKRQKDGKPNITDIDVPFPLPQYTVSIHIRHGDKAGEGRLISTRDYIVSAERFLLRNPIAFRKRSFVSTEDPGVIPEIHETAFINPVRSYGNDDWLWYYSDIPRIDAGPQANLVLVQNKTDALITHLVQLWMAIECDTFIGNRNSNWNKMIDSIRCTLMDKCHAPYFDAGFVADWLNFP